MSVTFSECCRRATLSRAATIIRVFAITPITFAHAQDRVRGIHFVSAMELHQNNPKLNQLQHTLSDHNFVNSFLGEAQCGPIEESRPDRIVIDPTQGGYGRSVKSLSQVVAGLRAPGPVVVLLRSGVHHLSEPLIVTEMAGALTIQACPGEIAVIDAPASGPAIILKDSRNAVVAGLVFAGDSTGHIVLNGAEDCVVERNTLMQGGVAITLDHAKRNRIVNNVIQGVASSGIELKDGSDANLVTDNVVDGVGATETFGGGIFLHGASDNRVAHNTVQQTAGFGIAVSNWDDATTNTGNVVEYNLLRNTVRNSDDSGAIYILGRSGIDTGIVIAGNVIDGFGSPGNHNVGIYLDDSTSGAAVIGNLVRAIGSDAVQIHGGQDNLIDNNLLDLGAGQPSAVLFQAAPADTNPQNRQTGNVVSRNVILSSNASPRPFVWYDGGTPDIAGNFYVVTTGTVNWDQSPAADQRPVMGDPALLPPPAAPGYGPVEIAAGRAIGFKPIDPAAAGIRRTP